MASCGYAAQRGLWPPRIMRFLDHTQRHATVGRTPLDQLISSSQRPLPYNTQQTNIHAPVGFEPTIAVAERPLTYTLDRAASGSGILCVYTPFISHLTLYSQ
jgi:hypothetical protein